MSEVASLNAHIGANASEFYSTLESVENRLQSASRSFFSVGAQMTAATAPLSVGLYGAVDAAISFESQFASVAKTVDASDQELAAIRDTIRDMATDANNPLAGLDNAHQTLAGVMAAAGQLGVATEDLVFFTETMGMLGMATNVSAEDAATLIAQFANVTGMDFSNVDRFGATLVDLGNNSATTESQILAMASRIASAGSNAGFSEQQILAWSASMASTGLTAELAGNNFTNAISKITTAVAEGGAGLEGFAAVAGIAADDFATMWSEDANNALLTFVQGLGEMDQAAQITALNELGLTGVELQRVLMTLAGNTDLVSDSLDTANDAWEENEALQNEAAARFATTEAQMSLLRNTVTDLGIEVGAFLLPELNALLDTVQPLVGDVIELAQANPELARGMTFAGVAAAALGPALMVVGGALAGLAVIVGTVTSPFFLLGAVVAGAAALIIANWESISGAFATASNFVEDKLTVLRNSFAWFRDDIQNFGIAEAIKIAFGVGETAEQEFGGESWVEGLLVSFGVARESAISFNNAIGKVISSFESLGKAEFDISLPSISIPESLSSLEGILGNIADFVLPDLDIGGSLGIEDVTIENIGALATGFGRLNGVLFAAGLAFTVLSSPLTAVALGVGALFLALSDPEGALATFSDVTSTIGETVANIGPQIAQALPEVQARAGEIWDGISAAAPAAAEAVGEVVGGLAGDIGTAITENGPAVAAELGALWEGIRDAAPTASEDAGEVVGQVVGAIGTALVENAPTAAAALAALWYTMQTEVMPELQGLATDMALGFVRGLASGLEDSTGLDFDLSGLSALGDQIDIIVDNAEAIPGALLQLAGLDIAIPETLALFAALVEGIYNAALMLPETLTQIGSASVTIPEALGTLGEMLVSMSAYIENIVAKIAQIGQITFQVPTALHDLKLIVEEIAGMIHSILSGLSRIGEGGLSLPSPGGIVDAVGSLLPGRAVGGPVVQGQDYIVGERGPEIFSPGASGHITPNNASFGDGGAIVIQAVHVHGPQNWNDVVDEIIRASERKGGRRLQVARA